MARTNKKQRRSDDRRAIHVTHQNEGESVGGHRIRSVGNLRDRNTTDGRETRFDGHIARHSHGGPSRPLTSGRDVNLFRPAIPVSRNAEDALLRNPGFIRWPNETGTLSSLPPFRRREFVRACYAATIELDAGSSLRRHHIKYRFASGRLYKKGVDHHVIDRLGCSADIRTAADIFENIVGDFLHRMGIDFVDEVQQKDRWKEDVKRWSRARDGGLVGLDGTPPLCPPTPDFILPSPIHLQGCIHPVCWIEVKHFYGAGSIPFHGETNHAICSLVPKARKYISLYGHGAYIFAYGVGEEMARELERLGIIILDSSVLKFGRLREQLRTWCEDAEGRIMP